MCWVKSVAGWGWVQGQKLPCWEHGSIIYELVSKAANSWEQWCITAAGLNTVLTVAVLKPVSCSVKAGPSFFCLSPFAQGVLACLLPKGIHCLQEWSRWSNGVLNIELMKSWASPIDKKYNGQHWTGDLYRQLCIGLLAWCNCHLHINYRPTWPS